MYNLANVLEENHADLELSKTRSEPNKTFLKNPSKGHTGSGSLFLTSVQKQTILISYNFELP